MRCYALPIPTSDACFSVPVPKSGSLSVFGNGSKPVNFPTRTINSGSLKVKASVSDGFAVEPSNLSFYELLGIPESGSLSEIKHAYKQLARKYHPDVSPPSRVEEYTKRFIQVQEAYETLSDPRSRALYDRDMAGGIHLAFSARRRYYDDDMVIEQKSEWRARWQSQLSELTRRNKSKDAAGNMSWAARMRQRRDGIIN